MSVILITGAAHGLGRALVEEFIEKGWVVLAVDIDPVVELIPESKPAGKCHAFTTDVTSEEEVKALKNSVGKLNLQVACIINNAGIFRFAPITDSDISELRQIFELNTFSPFIIINAFLNDLISTGGRVVQISSENVKLSGLFQPYPSTKIALESLSIAARQELSLVGVSLVIVRPGAIDTRLLNWGTPESSVYKEYLAKFMDNANKRMGKTISPQKVARKVFHAATTAKPKLIYSINHGSFLAIFALMPPSLQQRIIQRMLR